MTVLQHRQTLLLLVLLICCHSSLPPHNIEAFIMSSGMSNVGNRSLYEAGDQRTRKAGDEDEHKADRYHEGKEHSHKPNDSSMSIPSP